LGISNQHPMKKNVWKSLLLLLDWTRTKQTTIEIVKKWWPLIRSSVHSYSLATVGIGEYNSNENIGAPFSHSAS
jgi:hypothetical protein